ncbi:two-component system cell cycle sensor histidine kinase/response regulator CckA [Yoonia sediminilitoris]|uniref:histidine kinase n=2 Tax=Yoonia sediminilitoris TaxID=1286148 RepID=A0A2T6KRQ8_9RHOB|nr:two-component system cell cycle sensor histidine kinase/response regulator CckA [Yoonia sediminilitoris]RCW99417.1 two-component system cell cycle sensor histidine kinase/response regulator CckA [Yoonia sediminilitoris]
MPVTGIFLAIAMVCFCMGVFVPQLALKIGLATAGGIFCAMAGWRLKSWVKPNIGLGKKQSGYQSLVESDVDCTFVTDPQGMVIAHSNVASDQYGSQTGQSARGVFGRILADPDKVLDTLLEKVASGEAGKENVITQRGQFRLSVSPLPDAKLLWRIIDSGAAGFPLANGFTSGHLPTIIVDADNRIVQINDACQALLRARPEKLSEIVDSLPLRSGQQHRIKTANGKITAVIAELALDNGGTAVYLIPDTAAQTPRFFNAGWDAIEDLPVPLMKITPDGEVLASNREARLLLKIDDRDGQRIGEMLDGLGRPISDWLREAAEGRGGNISQFLRGRSGNQDTFVQVTLNISGEGADKHLIAVLNDVTELKTLEAQFVQSQKMQAIGQLAGGVAHDFNNLLTAISGHCDLLLLRHDEGDQNYGDLIQIHQNANRAASLVGQLLAFSRKQNLQPEIIDLRDTLSDLTHLLNRLVGEKVTLSLNHDPALSQIKADKRQLEQVLMNLVVNARDAMPSGGEIQVVTSNLLMKTQMVKDRAVVPPGEYVMVKVIDEGFGIAPEKLPKIFEPFYTTKRTGEGTGLGLSTAYGIVKQTGGYIFAESEVGKGTQFSLLFPSYDLPVAEPLDMRAPGPEPMSSEADGVVLLVEDEAPVRAFASRALRLRGYTVLEADCAEAALELLSNNDLTVDIFVTDVIMPGLDGPTWVRKALTDRPDTKVVFVSGYAEDAFGDDQSRIPNSVFLPKPFSLNALTQTVQAQLQEHA